MTSDKMSSIEWSKCYFKLDTVLRASLYQPFGSGYEEAYERSLKVLQPPLFVMGKMTCGDGLVGNRWPSWRCTKCNAEFCNDGSTPTECPRCVPLVAIQCPRCKRARMGDRLDFLDICEDCLRKLDGGAVVDP